MVSESSLFYLRLIGEKISQIIILNKTKTNSQLKVLKQKMLESKPVDELRNRRLKYQKKSKLLQSPKYKRPKNTNVKVYAKDEKQAAITGTVVLWSVTTTKYKKLRSKLPGCCIFEDLD